MNRFRLIVGIVLGAIIALAWNHFHSGVEVVSNFNEVTPASPLHISLKMYVVTILLWYGFNWINIINEWERRPVLLFGKYYKTAGPGIALIDPLFFTTLDDVTVQDQVEDVVVSDVQTKDNVGISLTGVLTYRIDPSRVKDSVVEVDYVDSNLIERALSTLTDVTATNDLDTLLEHRNQFCIDIQTKLTERVGAWGVIIKAFELKAFSINDEEVEKAIAMKARAAKEGSAEIVRASMQEQVATALNKAAATYSPEGRWLKGIETLLELCRSGNNNTILLPTDLTESLAKIRPLLPQSAQS